MNKEQKVEGLLFVAGAEGITLANLAELTDFAKPAVTTILEELAEKYRQDPSSALSLIQTGGTYKLVTKPGLAVLIKKYFARSNQAGLSAAALEILAIVAYRQPITRIEIDQIRGVHSGTTLQNLVLRNLIKVTGRLNEPGRPKTYGTTAEFLDYFGLQDLTELPALPEDSENAEGEPDDNEDLFLQEFESKMTTNKE